MRSQVLSEPHFPLSDILYNSRQIEDSIMAINLVELSLRGGLAPTIPT
jgi:hypothetical protein